MGVGRQAILRERRQYNQWVANETMEDYALRFTATKARKWSTFRVANTALGTVSFLVLEAIGATITLKYGVTNAVTAILIVGAIIFALGLPVSYYAAKYGVDIDLLTRGAGFGYIGSTITSLIYASFTFIFFALEAAIMARAVELCFGLPLGLSYLISALIVIPLVTYGFTFLSRFQFWTQFIWLGLQLIPLIYLGTHGLLSIGEWSGYSGSLGPEDGHFDLMLFGAAASVVFALVPQNAEQVDYLRFLPRQRKGRHWQWWTALVCAGPGWIVPGVVKMLVGSFLAVLLVKSGMSFADAAQPAQMYLFVFERALDNPEVAIAVVGIFVVVSQLKINVTNAYAGSLAWSNFFSRLTHTHPGRVVWVVFNVTLAWLLMELGIYETLERTLGLYSNIPVAWMGAIAADLAINKPLGLSPRHIEFKRAYLFDINPVGVGGMLLASIIAIATYAGVFGDDYHGLAPFVALGVSLVTVPLLAFLTKGRFYLARPQPERGTQTTEEIKCCICEHHFEPEDMASCPFYSGPICSLCCSLDVRCNDLCRDGARFSEQWSRLITFALPTFVTRHLDRRLAKYLGLVLLCSCGAALTLATLYVQMASVPSTPHSLLADTLLNVFFVLVIVIAIVVWPFLLANESSRAARAETRHQTNMLMQEIEAHQRTDLELQKAKEAADASSLAKSKYIQGISHELRTPLNAVLGYAQLLEANDAVAPHFKHGVRVIRRSADHLSSLVDGLLDISMIEAGRLQIYRDEVRLHDFLDQIVDMFSLQAKENGLEFTFEAPPNLPELVYIDGKRLGQILINLLQNAIRGTKQGGVTLRIGYASQVARFEIEDTGIGISPEDMERIFRPFERIETPNHPAKHGTGLGLTITRLLTEAMGGEITVKSTPGVGSCFSVRLMLSAVPETRYMRNIPRNPVVGYTGQRKTVLVVDDDPDHIAFMKDTLSSLGFSVAVAESGTECLDMAAETDPDAVLLDISMPGIDGWETARRLRAAAKRRIPIIIISADPRQESQRAISAEDHDAYLMKPLRHSVLLDTLKNLMDVEWIEAPPDRTEAAAPRAAAPQKIPSGIHLASLKRMGEIGHIRGILAKLDEIGAAEPDTAPTLFYLRRLAEDCDLDGYNNMIEALARHEA
jgi:signal transduction histidine kinase/CheY-like chemotaxis protein